MTPAQNADTGVGATRRVHFYQAREGSVRDPGPLETLTRRDVADAVDTGLSSNRPVRTLLQAMAQVGCPVDRSFFHIMRCSEAVGGGFAPDHGVILCHNRLHTRQEVLNAMVHELIHAYDHCRCGGGGAVRGRDWRAGDGRLHTASWSLQGAGEGPSSGPAATTSETSVTAADRGDCGDNAMMASIAPPEAAATEEDRGGKSSLCCISGGDGPACSGTAGEGGGVVCAGVVGSAAASGGSGGCGGGGGESSGCGGGGGSSCRGLDWSNCRHHACTEIRAANLSGDCAVWQELIRGNLPLLPHLWPEQQRSCVARRAALSVAMNPACGGEAEAAAVVSEMMATCLADTAPFEAADGVARP